MSSLCLCALYVCVCVCACVYYNARAHSYVFLAAFASASLIRATSENKAECYSRLSALPLAPHQTCLFISYIVAGTRHAVWLYSRGLAAHCAHSPPLFGSIRFARVLRKLIFYSDFLPSFRSCRRHNRVLLL